MDGDETGGREGVKLTEVLTPDAVAPVTGVVVVEFAEGDLRFLVDAGWGTIVVVVIVVLVVYVVAVGASG